MAINGIVRAVTYDRTSNTVYVASENVAGTGCEIQKYSGGVWTVLGTTTGTTYHVVNSIGIAASGVLYVGGNFTGVTYPNGTSIAVSYVARYSETSGVGRWDNMGGGLNGPVTKLVCDNYGVVHFIGSFTNLNTTGATWTYAGYARWALNSWSSKSYSEASFGFTPVDVVVSNSGKMVLILKYTSGVYNLQYVVVDRRDFSESGARIGALPVTTNDRYAACFDKNEGLYVGIGNTIYYSSDLSTWTTKGNVGSGYKIKKLFVSTDGKVYASTDNPSRNYLVDVNGTAVSTTINDVVLDGCSDNDGGIYVVGQFSGYIKYQPRSGSLGAFTVVNTTRWVNRYDSSISVTKSVYPGMIGYNKSTDEIIYGLDDNPLKKLTRSYNSYGPWIPSTYGTSTLVVPQNYNPIFTDGSVHSIASTGTNASIFLNNSTNATTGITDLLWTRGLVKFGNKYFFTAGHAVYVYDTSLASPSPVLFAGARDVSGSADSTTGTTARFNNPYSLAIDTAGNIFVADYSNNSIRKITQAGVVSTFAGSTAGNGGFVNGLGNVARFNNPLNLYMDLQNNLYVLDISNSAIRKILPTGDVSTIFNGITGFSSSLSTIVDNWNNIFISSSGNYVQQTEPIFGSLNNLITAPASSVTTTTASLNCTLNTNGVSVALGFDWGPTTAMSNVASVGTVAPTSVTNYAAPITGLTAGTTYYYRAVMNVLGSVITGDTLTFTTASTVTFDSSGGSTPAPTSKSVIVGTAYGTLPTVTKTGYNFTGWWTGSGGTGTLVTASTIVSIAGNHTLYAGWTLKTITVTFDDGNATFGITVGSVSFKTKTITYGQAIGTLPTFTSYYSDVVFDNWYSNSPYINPITAGSVLNSETDVVLNIYVNATAHPVVFKYEDGSTPDGSGSWYSISAYIQNFPSSTPTKTGYVFGGWYTGTNGTGVQFTQFNNYYPSQFAVNNTLTLYAYWMQPNYTVTFNYQSGLNPSGTTANTTKTVKYGSAYGTLPIATRAHYIFGGWYTGTNGTGNLIESTSTYDIIGNQTLYAKWTSAVVTVTFNPTSGTVSPTSASVEYGVAIGSLPTPTRSSYTFKNWYTGVNSTGTLYNSATVVAATSNFTLYAAWVGTPVTVNLDANGGTISPTSEIVEYNALYGTLPVPYLQGYTFNGWFTATSGGTQILASTVVTNSSTHTIHAQWTLKTLNITFDFQDNATADVVYQRTVLQQYGTLPTAPTRAGYTFNGWFTETNGAGTQIQATDMVALDEDATIYADWTGDSITVTFDGQGVTLEPNTTTAIVGDAYGTVYAPTRPGYTLSGWYTETAGRGTLVTASSTVQISTNHTLYAYWTGNNYIATFDANGGTVSIVSKTVVYNQEIGSLPIPTKANSIFKGWYYNGSLVKASDTMLLMDNFTLVAQWDWMVTFDKMIVTKEGEIVGTALLEDGTYIVRMAEFNPIKKSTNPSFKKLGGRISGTVTVVSQDSDGEIVIGTSLGGFKFSNGSWIAWGPTGGRILAITQDSKGRTVVGGTFNDKILRFDGTTWIPIARRVSGYGSLPMMVAYDIDWLGAFVPAENVLETIPTVDYVVLIREISIMPCNTDTIINVFEASKATTFTAFRFDTVTNSYVQFSGSFKLLDADGNFVKNIINGMSIAAGQWMISGSFSTTGKYRIREGWGTTTEGVDYVNTDFNVDCTFTTTTLTTTQTTTGSTTTTTAGTTTSTTVTPPPPPPPECQPYGGDPYGGDVSSVVPQTVCYNGTEYIVNRIGYLSFQNGPTYYQYFYQSTGGEQLYFAENEGTRYGPAWYLATDYVPGSMLGVAEVQCYDCNCDFTNLPTSVQYDIVAYSCMTGLPISISGNAALVSSTTKYKYYRDVQTVEGVTYQIEIKALFDSQTYSVEVYVLTVC